MLDLRAAFRTVANSSPIGRWFSTRPFFFLFLFGLVPHFIGSLVNIPYNLLLVAGTGRMAAFGKLVNIYNVLVYPLCLALCIGAAWPVFQWWRRRKTVETDDDRLAWLRRRVIWFPRAVAYIALLGWLPGAIWFPWGLNYLVTAGGADPLTWPEMFHLQASVIISGLIALTYSALGVAVMSVYVFYPQLWINPANFRDEARREVEPLRLLLTLIPFLAGAIPLCGAVLAVSTSRTTFSEAEHATFQIPDDRADRARHDRLPTRRRRDGHGPPSGGRVHENLMRKGISQRRKGAKYCKEEVGREGQTESGREKN